MKNTTQKFTFQHIMILVSTFLLVFSGMGIIFNCAGLFVTPICDSLGFSRSSFNLSFTIRSLVIMITSIATERVYQSLSPIKLMRISVVIVFISFFMMSFASSIFTFYLLTIVLSIAYTFMHVIRISIIIQSWFKSHIGMLTGIVFMGSGLGGMIFNVVAGILIEKFGWRIALKVLATILGISTIPTTFLFIRLTPAENDTKPFYRKTESYNRKDEIKFNKVQSKSPVSILPLSILIILTSFSSSSVMSNIVPHVVNIGFGNIYAASINSVCMAALAIFKVFFGKVSDRIGFIATTIINILSSIISLLLLSSAKKLYLMYVAALLTGISGTFGTVIVPTIAFELLGRREFSKNIGILSACSNMGIATAPILSGIFFDKTGSYVSYFIFTLFITYSALLISFTYFRRNY